MPEQPDRQADTPARIERRDAALGLFGIVLGIAVAAGATQFPGGSNYDVLGPRLMPSIIAAGLALTGLTILVGALRGTGPRVEREELALGPVLYVVAALVVPMLVIRLIGWAPTCAFIFALGARAFASNRPLLDLALGAAFGGATFAMFNYGLGLSLPVGSLFGG